MCSFEQLLHFFLTILLMKFVAVDCNEFAEGLDGICSIARNSDNNGGIKCVTESSLHETFVQDSVEPIFRQLDTDDTDYLTIEELVRNIQTSSLTPQTNAEALDKAVRYMALLDKNCDSVLDLHELRFSIHFTMKETEDETLARFGEDKEFIFWLSSFIAEETSRFYPFYLAKTFQFMDEDLNGKLTWKEIRMAIKTAELYKSVQESLLMDERGKEDLVASIKEEFHQKWLSLEELWALVHKLNIKSYKDFFQWMQSYLAAETELSSNVVSDATIKGFKNIDVNGDGEISKGELVATLHKHRKGYYTDARINRRWTRADRNGDNKVSFNEYMYLENLKHPEKK